MYISIESAFENDLLHAINSMQDCYETHCRQHLANHLRGGITGTMLIEVDDLTAIMKLISEGGEHAAAAGYPLLNRFLRGARARGVYLRSGVLNYPLELVLTGSPDVA